MYFLNRNEQFAEFDPNLFKHLSMTQKILIHFEFRTKYYTKHWSLKFAFFSKKKSNEDFKEVQLISSYQRTWTSLTTKGHEKVCKTLFWDDITIFWDENLFWFFTEKKKLFGPISSLLNFHPKISQYHPKISCERTWRILHTANFVAIFF
jgi:hypothetical protein